MRTLMEVVRLSAGYLGAHGSGSPRLDAELLAASALDLRRIDLYLQFDRPLEDEQLAAIRGLVRRRGDGEPVAYITGCREFYGRPLLVTPAVLIPRPETETLVTIALERIRSLNLDGTGVAIADLGTGSGCLAVTLAAELPGAEVAATEVSPTALEVAAANAARHAVGARVELVAGSWAEPLAGRGFDVMVANPPYIRSGELAGLSRDVVDWEPRLALDGGLDGLDCYRSLLPSAARVLAPGGWLALEIDIRAAAAVSALGIDALGAGATAHVHNDLTGRPRVASFCLERG